MRFWRKYRKASPAPEFIKEYLSLDFNEKSSFCVLDCETSGMGKKSEILTLGAVTIQDSKIILNSILDLRFPVIKADDSSEIHGELKNDMAPSQVQENLKRLLSYLKNYVLVGHYISFDIKMINRAFQSIYPGFRLKNRHYDTIQLSKRSDPIAFERSVGSDRPLSLEKLCDKHGIPIENRHTALGDSYMTALLFLSLKSRLEARGVDIF